MHCNLFPGKKHKFIAVKRTYAWMNDVQLVGWNSVLLVSLFRLGGCPPLLLWFTMGVQLLNVYDLYLILSKARNGAVLPWVLQNGARVLFLALLLIAKQQDIEFMLLYAVDAASVLLIVWSLAEISRFAFYVFKTDFLKMLRYSAFLICYPAGVAIELVWIYYLYTGLPYTFAKIFLAILVIAYIVGFPYLFLHLYRSRKQKLNHE